MCYIFELISNEAFHTWDTQILPPLEKLTYKPLSVDDRFSGTITGVISKDLRLNENSFKTFIKDQKIINFLLTNYVLIDLFLLRL
jgi:hypothetical protein